MIRQAHTYLVSAMSGATLIAIAIAVFVVLVSAQVFRDWPIAALGDSGDSAAVRGLRARARRLRAARPSLQRRRSARERRRRQRQGGRAAAGDGEGGRQPAPGDLRRHRDRRRSGAAAGPSRRVRRQRRPARLRAGAGLAAELPRHRRPGSAGSGGGSGGGGRRLRHRHLGLRDGHRNRQRHGQPGRRNRCSAARSTETGVTEVTEGVVNGVAGPESIGRPRRRRNRRHTVGGLLAGGH